MAIFGAVVLAGAFGLIVSCVIIALCTEDAASATGIMKEGE